MGLFVSLRAYFLIDHWNGSHLHPTVNDSTLTLLWVIPLLGNSLELCKKQDEKVMGIQPVISPFTMASVSVSALWFLHWLFSMIACDQDV